MKTSIINSMLLDLLKNSDEKKRRQLAGLEAIKLGWGGITKICNLTKMSPHTVRKGILELKLKSNLSNNRVRKKGGGRKKIIDSEPEVLNDLEKIINNYTAGNPMKHLIWTNKSLSNLTAELNEKKHKVSRSSVRRILIKMGYTLQSNKKSKEGKSDPNRDSQFHYINKQISDFLKTEDPVISVDTKKKELIGNFKNSGKRWMKSNSAEIVNVYDFPSLAKGKVAPYGLYDIQRNEGFVNVGTSADTSEFAVNSIETWWNKIGKKNYSKSKRILITADCGGSNSSRSKLWKYYLQKFSNKYKIKITVCHYPPSTSKWNKIEHKMFSFISINWKGKPLLSYKIIINLIKGTKTKKGLKIDAKLDKTFYEKGKKLTKQELNEINLEQHDVNPNWNYSISF
jgi:hypothetical protein